MSEERQPRLSAPLGKILLHNVVERGRDELTRRGEPSPSTFDTLDTINDLIKVALCAEKGLRRGKYEDRRRAQTA